MGVRVKQPAISSAHDLGQLDLLRVVAMELQQPLTHIAGLASMLKDGTFSPDELPLQYRKLETSSLRMQRIIESLLYAGQVESRQIALKFEPINVASVVHNIANDLKPVAMQYHRSLNPTITQAMQPVVGSRDAIKHGLYNLLDVVIRSSESEVIDILVHHQLDSVMVTIRDDGERLPSGALKSILRRMGQTSQPLKQLPGSAGLGLYVASVLTEHMRGDLNIETHRGKRILSMSLPLSKQASLL